MNKKKLNVRYYFLEYLLNESSDESASYQRIVNYVLGNLKDVTKKDVLDALRQLSNEGAISKIANSFTHENAEGSIYPSNKTFEVFKSYQDMRKRYLFKIFDEMFKPKNVAAKLNNFVWFCLGTLIAFGIEYLKILFNFLAQ